LGWLDIGEGFEEVPRIDAEGNRVEIVGRIERKSGAFVEEVVKKFSH